LIPSVISRQRLLRGGSEGSLGLARSASQLWFCWILALFVLDRNALSCREATTAARLRLLVRGARRERDSKDPEPCKLGKAVGGTARDQPYDRGRNLLADQPADRRRLALA
jgi:hypothetical protein